PAVAMDGTGDYVVAWESYNQDGSRFGVYARRYNSAGAALGSEFKVNTTTLSDQRTPRIAIDSAGDFVVAWSSLQESNAGILNYGISGQRSAAAGTPDGGEFHVNTYTTGHQTVPAVASDSAGRFVVVWSSDGQDGSGTGIYGQRFQSQQPPKLQA